MYIAVAQACHPIIITSRQLSYSVPLCTCGFDIQEKIRCGLRFLAYFRAVLQFSDPPYAPLYEHNLNFSNLNFVRIFFPQVFNFAIYLQSLNLQSLRPAKLNINKVQCILQNGKEWHCLTLTSTCTAVSISSSSLSFTAYRHIVAPLKNYRMRFLWYPEESRSRWWLSAEAEAWGL